MANAAQFVLQVSDYTLAGIDKTNRTIRVKGNAIPIIVPGSLATIAVDAAGTANTYDVGDLFSIAGGGVGKVTVLTANVPSTVVIVSPGSGITAATGAATTAIAPSVGVGLTVTTTVNAGAGGLLIITAFSVASGVATFQCVNSLTTGGGQSVVLQGFTGTYASLNGLFTTASATATTFTVSLAVPNVGTTSVQATATVQGTYLTGGIPVSFSFVDQNGNPRPVAGIGPLAKPTWVTLQTKEASVLSYQTNIVSTYPVVRMFTSGAEVANAAVIPADVIGFLAEFTSGAF
jgi:hypothetical protein